MTLTEEQRPTAGFDLEKARDVEKAMSPMPWIVLEEAHGEMIIIRNPNHPMYIDGIVAWGRVAEANTPDAIGIAYMRENFSNLIGEIERLRASLVEHEEHENQTHEVLGNILGTDDTLENVAKRAAARIKELEADLEQSERVIEARLEVIDQQAARIKELEDALAENLAADIAYDDRLLWSRLDGQRQDEYREKARQQLQAGGKIGTGARPPCWQITEDRVTAIDQGLRFLEWSNAKTGIVETKKRIATLQTMLEEASDEHGFER